MQTGSPPTDIHARMGYARAVRAVAPNSKAHTPRSLAPYAAGPKRNECALPLKRGLPAPTRARWGLFVRLFVCSFVRLFVCSFVRLECLFVVVPCATAGPAPVRRQHARKARWGYSGYSRMGLGGPVPAAYGRTRARSRHAQCTRAHPRVPAHTSRTHPGMAGAHARSRKRRTHMHTHSTGTHARTGMLTRTHARTHIRTRTRARLHAHPCTHTHMRIQAHAPGVRVERPADASGAL
jgi:hypothetical protein